MFTNLCGKRSSVNSSLSTVKADYKNKQNTHDILNKIPTNKNLNIRYSYQGNQPYDPFQNINSQDQISDEFNRFSGYSDRIKLFCFNHSNLQASHCALQTTNDPLYCCQRCAILIASKGFDIKPIIQKDKQNERNSKSKSKSSKNLMLTQNKQIKMKKNTTQNQNNKKIFITNQIKNKIKQTWNSTKQIRKQSLQKIDICLQKLNDSIQIIENFYYKIHQFIQSQKIGQIQKINFQIKSLQSIRHQTNNFYHIYLQQIKRIKDKLYKNKQYSLIDYQNVINKVKNGELQLNLDKILLLKDIKQNMNGNYENSRKNINQICEQIKEVIMNNGRKLTDKSNSKSILPRASWNANQKNRPNLEDLKQFNYNNHSGSSLLMNSNANSTNQFIHNSKIKQRKSLLLPQSKIIPKQQKIIESSVRSLQLSFDSVSSSKQSQSSQFDFNRIKQESNNFTLNQYLNQTQNNKCEQNSSYMTNLLLTSTDV